MLDGDNIKPLDKLLRMLYFPLAKFLVKLLHNQTHKFIPDDLFEILYQVAGFFPLEV
jgi:hypothetical protein